MAAPSKPSIASPEGIAYARKLVRPVLPHDLHDHILEGICQALAGLHCISVLATGGGKTSYMYGFMKLLGELEKLQEPCPFEICAFPKKALMVAVFPTKGLEEDMEKTFQSLNLTTLVINEDTLAAAEGDLWAQATSPDLSILLISPEQFASRPFDNLLHTASVSDRLISLGMDELHLILDWGGPGFREAYRDVGCGLARMPDRVVLFGVTATLPAGQETRQLVDVLSLKPGSFFFKRRSNIRRDVRLVVRTLRHGLGGWSFPDLRWIVAGRRKTIVYCDTISLAFRIFVDLWYSIPNASSSERESHLRMYCSLFSKAQNSQTRVLFIDDPDMQVIFATDALKVGNDFPNVANVVILNPVNVNDILQKMGRAGRKKGMADSPRGILYVTKGMLERARDVLDGKPPKRKKKKQATRSHAGSDVDEKMSMSMARFLLAECYIKELDAQYDNPSFDPPCACETCRSTPQPHPSLHSCNCSRCIPERVLPPLKPKGRQPSHIGYIPRHRQLNKEMKSTGRQRLVQFREGIWYDSEDSKLQSLPPSAVLSDSTVDWLLQNFHHLNSVEQMRPFLGDTRWLEGHESELFEVVLSLSQAFWKRSFNALSDGSSVESGDNQPTQRLRLEPQASTPTSTSPSAIAAAPVLQTSLLTSYDSFFNNLYATRGATSADTSRPLLHHASQEITTPYVDLFVSANRDRLLDSLVNITNQPPQPNPTPTSTKRKASLTHPPDLPAPSTQRPRRTPRDLR